MHIVLFANSYETFKWHRSGLARELQKLNQVSIILPETDSTYKEEIDKEFKVLNIKLSRKGTNLLTEIFLIIKLYRLLKKMSPDLVHNFTVKCVIYGSLCAKLLNLKTVNSITGLGYVFINNTIKARILRKIITGLYKFILKNTKVIFQNQDDQNLFSKLRIISKKDTFFIPGSGIDLTKFKESNSAPHNPEKLRFLYVGRLLRDKGLLEILAACKTIKEPFEFSIVGNLDLENPNSLNEIELQELTQHANYLGFLKDSSQTIIDHDVIVLPSYREGLSKFLLEGLAAKKAILTTNVPGCRDLVSQNKNGLLIPAKNSEELARAMQYFITKPDVLINMGKNSYEMAQEFDIGKINKQIINTYE